jgi:hypothetical protein
VKKNMVIESFESTRESFARGAGGMLRGRGADQLMGDAAAPNRDASIA